MLFSSFLNIWFLAKIQAVFVFGIQSESSFCFFLFGKCGFGSAVSVLCTFYEITPIPWISLLTQTQVCMVHIFPVNWFDWGYKNLIFMVFNFDQNVLQVFWFGVIFLCTFPICLRLQWPHPLCVQIRESLTNPSMTKAKCITSANTFS